MRKIFLIYLLTLIYYLSFSQKIHRNFNFFEIDTLYIISPFGQINSVQNSKILPDDELNINFQDIYKKNFSTSCPFVTEFVELEKSEADSINIYFSHSLDILKNFDNSVFQKLNINPTLSDKLNKLEGRYFAIINYSGFQQDGYGTKIVADLIVGSIFSFFLNFYADIIIQSNTLLGNVIASLIGGGMYIIIFPKSPFLHVNLTIIDKQTGSFLYFSSKETDLQPLKQKTINKNTKRIFRKLLKVNN